MMPPKAPVEVGAAVKAAAGTWKCQGSTFMPDGTATPMKATMKTKVALDNFWALMVDNMGGQEVSTSDGPKENKVMWESVGRSFMGEAKARHYEEMAGKELKLWGEWSMDKGKTWTKGYEATCKK